ncbi:G patch domain-containing protein 1 homolog [Prorops nasuta]|uniref:G patch domain-containing protein 1 homolog n=1 Tax=Prorops nasuta TaxID=863751 RepID=UPI0034CDC361
MSDSDEENFAKFGVPLEPLDEDNIPRKKAITIEEQFAYDAQGRRRFHGAFTGGFSAGYFNSVGTRDGWRPQQFKSSRSSKAENVSQRPEDFMDEEDTSEFGIAPKGIRATSDYVDHGQKGKKRERSQQNSTGPIPGIPVLQELLKPAMESVGVVLLKKMGWKPGQGIGPRLTKKEKAKMKYHNEKVKTYGCALPKSVQKEASTGSDESDLEMDITLAPDDYEPYRCNPKDNYFGIGYTGLDRNPVLSGHVNLFDLPAFNIQDKNKKLSIRGQAFGVGAFEADDDDIYEREDMSRYDFTLGPEHKKKSRWSKHDHVMSHDCLEGFINAKNNLKAENLFPPPVLPKNFVPVHLVRKSRFYPPIEFQPQNNKHRELNAKDRGRILDDGSQSTNLISTSLPITTVTKCSTDNRTQSVASNIIHRTLNLDGKKFAEEKQKNEVHQTTSSGSWMDKLNAQSFVKGGIENKTLKFEGNLTKLSDFNVNDISETVSNNQENSEKSGESFRNKIVFAEPDKQSRFEKYLTFLKNNEADKLESIQPMSLTEWEREQEAVEFRQAAKIYNNTIGCLSDKFTNGDKFSNTNIPLLNDSLKSDVQSAVKLKMFGKLTHTICDWKPASIVCKRFNIPEPKTGCANPEVDKKVKKFSVFESLDWSESSKFAKAVNVELNKTLSISDVSKCHTQLLVDKDLNSSSTNVQDIDNSEELTGRSISTKLKHFEASYEKIFGTGIPEISPSRLNVKVIDANDSTCSNLINQQEDSFKVKDTVNELNKGTLEEKKDLFKAIFLSSSEDSESEIEESVDSEEIKSVLIGKVAEEMNKQRNTSPPRGIFAKLDLNNFTSPSSLHKEVDVNSPASEVSSRLTSNDEVKPKDADNTNESLAEVSLLPNAYGPALPIRRIPIDNEEGSAVGAQSSKPIFKSIVGSSSDKDLQFDGKWVERDRLKKSKKEKKKSKHKDRRHSRHKRKSKKEKRQSGLSYK